MHFTAAGLMALRHLARDRRKVAICAAHGIEGRVLAGEGAAHLASLRDGETAWRAIYAGCLATMEACDCVIADLTPSRALCSRPAGTPSRHPDPGPRPAAVTEVAPGPWP